MTTIAYKDNTLVTDTRWVKDFGDAIHVSPRNDPKGILIKNDKGRVVGVLGITGAQPKGADLEYIQCVLSKGPDIATATMEKNKKIANIFRTYTNDSAIVMYHNKAYLIKFNSTEEIGYPFQEITEFAVVGSGTFYASTLLLADTPITELMKHVSVHDGLTSPTTIIYLQNQLEAF